MTQQIARVLLLLFLAGLGLSLFGGPVPAVDPRATASPQVSQLLKPPHRVVFFAGNLSEDQLLAFTTNLAASPCAGIVLLNTPKADTHNQAFLKAYHPESVVPVGSFAESGADFEKRLGFKTAPLLPWGDSPPLESWKALFPEAHRVVVCPAEPRPLLLQSACLAGVLHAPLLITRGEKNDAQFLARLFTDWHTQVVYAAGKADQVCQGLAGSHVFRLTDDRAVTELYLRCQRRRGPIHTLVVANPADVQRDLSGMSSLAPWVALQSRAALLLTNQAGTDVPAVVRAALKYGPLTRADALFLLADLNAIPMERRPNPVAGKDAFIEMEPMTPIGEEPFSFATGRLFNPDAGIVALVLARRHLLEEAGPSRKALIVSNATGGLHLLETLSRNTAKELQNTGYQTTARFGKEVNKDDLRGLMPGQDLILWEGHYNTLVKDYGFWDWTEPLSPALVFLQSCLALNEYTANRVLNRGAIGLVGSSTRTFAVSGGAFALAYFDALLYDRQSLGGSLRQAKNFLLAYSLLKQKRLGKGAHLGGANLRSAWAFSLWGDPTLKLPAPQSPEDALPAIRHRVHGNSLLVDLPDTAHEITTSDKYRARMVPNARLAGLVAKASADEEQLVPFVFVEVHLSRAPAGKKPCLHSHIPSSHWVFCWDARRRCGYLLVTPRTRDRGELRFHITWEDNDPPPITVAQHTVSNDQKRPVRD